MAKARRGRRRSTRSAEQSSGDQPLGGSLRQHYGADGRPKTAFTSESEAQRASFDRRLHDGIDLEVYRCSICASWHLARPRT